LLIIITKIAILFWKDVRPWYLANKKENGSKEYFETFASFLILFNYIIPISLYVTMGILSFNYQERFINKKS
jgi:magnesium-transporting ATPase (P-type)